MKKLLIFSLIVGALAACSKDKYQTTPQVTITSFGPSEVTNGQLIQLTADVTDDEGDFQDTITVYRKVYTLNGTLFKTDSLTTNLNTLGVPQKRKIEIQVTLVYGQSRPEIGPIQNGDVVDRKLKLGIIVKDKAGNRSELVESDMITLKKN